jgi:polysaccharide deacetylase family protein (PEP-CTERM system associated)
MQPLTNILTFDVEDWYHGIERPARTRHEFTPRLEQGLDVTLELLAQARVTATFFVLGAIAERYPDSVRRIAAAGHEVGTHGHEHEKIYELDPSRFRAVLRRSIAAISEVTGSDVIGHRAPFFSVTRQSLWALDILREEGIRYDASVYPGANYRYGIPGFRPDIHRLANGLIECPVSTFSLLGRRLGIGGAYLRLLPGWLTAKAIRSWNRRGAPASVYLHPWEFDPGHPRVRFRRRAMLTHYANLRSTAPKLRRLLAEFRFAPFATVLAPMLASDEAELAGGDGRLPGDRELASGDSGDSDEARPARA